jgi:hypothetical protein
MERGDLSPLHLCCTVRIFSVVLFVFVSQMGALDVEIKHRKDLAAVLAVERTCRGVTYPSAVGLWGG